MVLPKEMRLKGYKCFDYLHRSGKRYRSTSMLLKVTKANNNLIKGNTPRPELCSCRCAISISNKVSKKAVIRNRLRRLLHDHLKAKLFKRYKFSNNWALISLNPNCLKKDIKSLLKECDRLFIDAGFLS